MEVMRILKALNLKLDKRYSNGLNLLANYTWSKFIYDIQDGGPLGVGHRRNREPAGAGRS